MLFARYNPGSVTESRMELYRAMKLLRMSKFELLRSATSGTLEDKEGVRPFGVLCLITQYLWKDIGEPRSNILKVYWSKYDTLVSIQNLISAFHHLLIL